MVQELRQIMLTSDELLEALEAHRRMRPEFLPKGDIIGFDVMDASSIKVNINLKDSADNRPLVLLEEHLLLPLIRFCIENNIMLPRAGRKSVVVTPGSISLCVSLDVETTMGEMMALRPSSLLAFVN